MKARIWTGVVLALACLLIVVLSGCGNGSQEAPPTTSASEPATTPADKPPMPEEEPTTAAVGHTFTVNGTGLHDEPTVYSVTLVKVDQHAKMVYDPEAGTEATTPTVTAGQFKVTGITGTSQGGGSSLAYVDQDGNLFIASGPIGGKLAHGPGFSEGGNFLLSPGETVTAWVPLTSDDTDTVLQVQWTPEGDTDLGQGVSGPQPVTWDVAGQ